MAIIADRYQDDHERSRIMGILMGGIAAGVLVGYPLGGIMYDFVSQRAPLLVVASLLVLDAVLLLVVLRPRLEPERLLIGTSIRKLMLDPYILLASGAIAMSTFSIAILEPCLPIWLMESMSPPKWQLGTVFIPDSLGYFIGTNFFGEVGFKIGRWLTAMISLVTVGVCALTVS
ncbi:synaptic vesicular amine transporter [Trichonephila inaurata madagascariensis]|uniref:Synaptic vesicular amine transporter n=1 Tax=Trichonephila inaurata madagascariensis TaxID=2747483 RepID=A0A8X7C5H6_9ARAC|nr:synaptic vesicular amine transporter [Trichonephila inaurata madagascariensis]